MRNAIIEILGNLIRDIANSEDEGEPGQQKRELDNFFDLLFERFLDLSAYVRSKVVQVFLKILDIHTNRFAHSRLRLTALAARSLEDKTSTVRKNCIALLVKLILTHPFGALHGGELDMSKFEEGYKRVCDELAPMEAPSQEVLDAMAHDEAAAEEEDKENSTSDATPRVKREPREEALVDSDEESSDEDETREERRAKAVAAKEAQKVRRQSNGAPRKSDFAISAALTHLDQDKLTKLCLTKRYYADALIFIADLEKAVPLVETLLASKVKSEVLEAMEFFKVAYEYKLSSAEVSLCRTCNLASTQADCQ
jgi:condensin complex subunit 1